MDLEQLFFQLYNSSTEADIDKVFLKYPDILQNDDNWYPLDGNESNFGLIETQQSSSIAALIEKITNSIDAILMKKCFEAGIAPNSSDAPKSMEEAICKFFDSSSSNWHENWNLSSFRQKQSEEIQIHADGPRMETSLIIYDNGEGQHPSDFEGTFLSLLKGNKNEISFVQGKYNMGGTGAIIFCGKKRYQLIASKKFDGTGNFGFTLTRSHPMSEHERLTKKNTWYEYFKFNEAIPNFPIDELDLGLKNRSFKTGTIIKLYSYDLPEGSRSVISRDLNQSISEFLFEPALPIYTIDKPERYPKDRNLARDLFGLKYRLEQDDLKYIGESFSEDYEASEIGKMKVTCYVFNTKIKKKSVKESKESISREFFKNNMTVLFSQNGQTHGHYTKEFVTRSLKMPLLKNHLLIHVDCTHMRYEFRKELFMASRDRLKISSETRELRKKLSELLAKGKLREIYKRRKDSITAEVGDTQELLKSFTKTIPLNSDLLKLLHNTFKIDIPKEQTTGNTKTKKQKDTKIEEPFIPKRFPSFFKLHGEGSEEKPAAKIPLGSARTIRFLTDVENQYFDRIKDPGDLKLCLLSFKPNEQTGGTAQGSPKQLSDLLNLSKSSPDKGTIKISLNPTKEINIDDLIQIKATLEGPETELEEMFWVKIVDKEKPPQKPKKKKESKQDSIGLPQYYLIFHEKKVDYLTWEKFEKITGATMEFKTIMHPLVEGDRLVSIYINMDSSVLKSYKARFRTITEEQIELAEKKYISSVYFHTLFLYTISKNRNYAIMQDEKDAGLDEYLKDVFSSYYSEFLLNFGTEHLMTSLEL